MPSTPTLNQVRAVAARALSFHAGIRQPNPEELELVAEAVEGGALVRRDDAWVDFLINEGGLPVDWQTYVHSEDFERGDYQRAAGVQAIKRDAFLTRMTAGDLTPLAYRVVAQRAALGEAA